MDEVSELLHQGAIGTAAVYVIQWLKGAGWFPWLNDNSARVTRWIGIIIAFITSAGVKYAASLNPDGSHHIVLDLPTYKAIFDTGLHALAQFGGQQVLYHTAVKETVGDIHPAPIVKAQLEEALNPEALQEKK